MKLFTIQIFLVESYFLTTHKSVNPKVKNEKCLISQLEGVCISDQWVLFQALDRCASKEPNCVIQKLEQLDEGVYMLAEIFFCKAVIAIHIY